MSDRETPLVRLEESDFTPSPSDISIMELVQRTDLTSESHVHAIAPYEPSIGAHLQDAQKQAQKVLNDFVKSNPDKFAFLGEHVNLRVEAKAFIKPNPGAAQVYEAIIGHILTPGGAQKSQTAVREYVKQQLPAHTIPKDWTKPLPSWALRKIKERLRGSFAPMCDIVLPRKATLSQLHKAAAVAVERHKTGMQSFKPVIELSDSSVVINGKPFKIAQNKVKGGVYEYVRLSVPKLLEALNARK